MLKITAILQSGEASENKRNFWKMKSLGHRA